MTTNPNDLTTLATLQNYLSPGSSDTVLLQRLLTSASIAIENYLNLDIISQSYSDVYDGNGRRVMFLPQSPITAVASVTVNGNTIPAGSVTAAGFYFTKDKIILNGYEFCKGYGNVAIAYTAGYAAAPPDIEQFCIGTVQYWLNDRQRAGEVSKTMGGQTISYSQADMPNWVKTGLSQLKRVIPV